MGLLETILARLDRAEKALDLPAIDAGQPDVADVYPATPAVTSAPAATGDINEHGIPWHADHHAGTKTKTRDGHWTGKRGGDKVALKAYEDQFLGKSSGPATPATPAVPTPPAPPAVPTPPAPPAVPAVPTPPAPPAPKTVLNQAMANVNELVNTFKVPYPLIISTLVESRGVTHWDNVSPNDHAAIVAETDLWLELQNAIDQALELLENIDVKTGRVNGLPAAAKSVIQGNAGVVAAAEIPFDKLVATEGALTTYANQWNDYCKATTGAGF